MIRIGERARHRDPAHGCPQPVFELQLSQGSEGLPPDEQARRHTRQRLEALGELLVERIRRRDEADDETRRFLRKLARKNQGRYKRVRGLR